ncbi:MAG: pyridoxamine 5'-phosphate oxidase family protein [Solirubrobacterales bacterium]
MAEHVKAEGVKDGETESFSAGLHSQPLDWSWVERKLITSGSYWLVTTKLNGAPHARPVWGVYHDHTIWFSTGRSSVKGRNLAADPRCVLHVESADDVVIIDGSVELVESWEKVFESEPAHSVLRQYMAKYVMTEQELSPSGELYDAALYRVWPHVVNAWLEGAYPTTQSRWVLDALPVDVSG